VVTGLKQFIAMAKGKQRNNNLLQKLPILGSFLYKSKLNPTKLVLNELNDNCIDLIIGDVLKEQSSDGKI